MKKFIITFLILFSLIANVNLTNADDKTDAMLSKFYTKIENKSLEEQKQTLNNILDKLNLIKTKLKRQNDINLVTDIYTNLDNKIIEIDNKIKIKSEKSDENKKVQEEFKNNVNKLVNDYEFKKQIVNFLKNNLLIDDTKESYKSYFNSLSNYSKDYLSENYDIKSSTDLENILSSRGGIGLKYKISKISENDISILTPTDDLYLKDKNGNIIGVFLSISNISQTYLYDEIRGKKESKDASLAVFYGIDNKIYNHFLFPIKTIKNLNLGNDYYLDGVFYDNTISKSFYGKIITNNNKSNINYLDYLNLTIYDNEKQETIGETGNIRFHLIENGELLEISKLNLEKDKEYNFLIYKKETFLDPEILFKKNFKY